MAGSRREVFRIADLVVTFQEEPGLDCYLVFELQETKVKTSVSLSQKLLVHAEHSCTSEPLDVPTPPPCRECRVRAQR